MENELIANHRDNDEFLELARLNRIPLGLGIGCELDNHIRFKVGTFNIVLGHPNTGKTYFVAFYLLCMAKIHDKKSLIYSAENTINTLKRNLLELYIGKEITKMSEGELEVGKAFIEKYIDFVSIKKIWLVEDFMREVQKQGNYDILMIDPLNSFKKPRGMNSHDADYENASKLRLFGQMTGTTVYLVMHTTSESQRRTHKDGDFEGMRSEPTAPDAEGGGKWFSRCDDFIIVHRYTQSPSDWMRTRVTIAKIKETESGGRPTFLTTPVIFTRANSTQFECNKINPLL